MGKCSTRWNRLKKLPYRQNLFLRERTIPAGIIYRQELTQAQRERFSRWTNAELIDALVNSGLNSKAGYRFGYTEQRLRHRYRRFERHELIVEAAYQLTTTQSSPNAS